jgi:hypothetical protein
MQSVLCLDLSVSPSEIVVATFGEGGLVSVTERTTVDLGPFNSPEILRPDLLVQPPATEEDPTPEELESLRLYDEVVAARGRLTDSLAPLKGSWEAAMVVVPPQSFVSLNVDLPFADPKSISKILDLEVQDVVPFDLDEFVVQHSSVLPETSSTSGAPATPVRGFDVHVGLIPKIVIRHALSLAQGCGVEPELITSPSSLIAGAFDVASQYFKENAAIIVASPPFFSIAVRVQGRTRIERVVTPPSGPQSPESLKTLLNDLRLTVASVERRYGQRIETIYLFGNGLKSVQLEQTLARPVEEFTMRDLVRTPSTGEVGIAALAPVFFRDEMPVSLLSNFRVKEFAYRPKFGVLLGVFRKAANWICVALTLLVLTCGVLFAARRYEVGQREAHLIGEIRRVIPDFTPPPDGDIIGAIRRQEILLSDQLGALGSPSRASPFDALGAISRDLPSDIPGLQVNMLKIGNSRVDIEGVAPDLSAIAKIEKALKDKGGMYKKVAAKAGSASSTKGYRFSLEISLGE